MGVVTTRITGTIKGYENGVVMIEPVEISLEVDGRVTKRESVDRGTVQTFKVSPRIIPRMVEYKADFVGQDGVITIQGDEVVNLDF